MKRTTLLAALAASLAPVLCAAQAPAAAKDGLLANSSGMTLYTFDKDTAGKSACNGKCAENWPPALASDGAKPMGAWTLVARDDGLKQWALNGKPVYAFVKDAKAGDKAGDGFMNGAWHLAKP